jgi:2-amino-4-hydroxy-6-hydroxymethyldihydropteridine diphosphokinase
MAEVVIAIGSNLGDRLNFLRQTAEFLEKLSSSCIRKSSIWESEPVGPAEYQFYNAVAVITTGSSAAGLLDILKNFERQLGRESNPKKWAPRIIDLDIISYNSLVIQTDSLIIPHPEYQNRLFVLLPLQELFPDWSDFTSGKSIKQIIENAPDMMIRKTDLTW